MASAILDCSNLRWRCQSINPRMAKPIWPPSPQRTGFGIVRNRPFVGGNKQTALAAMIAFLGLNRFDLDAPREGAAGIVLCLAAEEISEDILTRWMADHIRALDGPGT